jgi:hypothetical protein
MGGRDSESLAVLTLPYAVAVETRGASQGKGIMNGRLTHGCIPSLSSLQRQ